jgi:glycosyltransferase involved in cell wall biosynthesis
MKILVLTSTYSRWNNDTEPKFVDYLCQSLAKENTIHVIAPHTRGTATQEVLDGIEVFRFRYFFEPWQTLAYDGGILPNLKEQPLRFLLVPFFLVSQWLLAVRLLRKNHYDIIHAHWIIPQGLVAILVKLFTKSKPAVVLTSHGGDLFALKGALTSQLKKWITHRAQALTVVSEAMKRKAVELGLKEDSQISYIPMGVDAQGTFLPPPEGADREGLLFVGRLVDKKGIEYLLKALPLVLAKYPDERLTVIGDGPLKHALAELCSTLNITDHVVFKGALVNSEIPIFLQKASITIFPSVVTDSGDQEGSPVAIMEALACGCATIVADYPGAGDIITHRETGLIVQGKSPEKIAEAVLALIESPELRQSLGGSGRNWVLAHYDWSVVSGKFLSLFHRLTSD